MDKLLKIAQQWSTWRGIGITIAGTFGFDSGIVDAAVNFTDHVPQLLIQGVALYDVLRDETRKR